METSEKPYPSPEADYEQIVPNAQLFYQTLTNFLNSIGRKFVVPAVGGKDLDLHRLFVEVTSRGGIQKVISDRRWKEVTGAFSSLLPIPNPSFVLRHHYMSLLYHYEQAYYFRKQFYALSAVPDTTGRSTIKPEDLVKFVEGSSGDQEVILPSLGSSVFGTIDGKCDYGYIFSVKCGSGNLTGMLFHVPEDSHVSQSSQAAATRQSRNASRDPSRPKPNRSGYNFFFAEHYSRLKPLYLGQERGITREIGHLWSNLSEAEKQVYQEKGLRDKERYKAEMLEYQSANNRNV